MPTFVQCAELANAAYDGVPGAPGWSDLSGEVAVIARDAGFSGAVFLQYPVGVVSFRGSVESTDWIHADTDMVAGKLPGQLGEAFSYFSAARKVLDKRKCKRIVVVGHSLGGALAALVGARVTTFPVRALTFNAPGCKGLERLGSPVDGDDRALARTMDDVSRLGFGNKSLNPVARVGVGTGALIAATFQTAGLAARRTMQAAVGVGGATLQLPQKNSGQVWNIVAMSRHMGQEIASRKLGGYIGNTPYRVPVDVPDLLFAHKMGPLIAGLRKSPIGAYNV